MLRCIAALRWMRPVRPIACRSVYPFPALTQVPGVSTWEMVSNPQILTRVKTRCVPGWRVFQPTPRNRGSAGGGC